MMKVINPATEEVLRELEEDDHASVARKAAAARAAQKEWASTSMSQRLGVARRFGELLAERSGTLAALLTGEMGKPIRQSRNELAAMQPRIAFFLEHSERALADEVVLQ